MMRTWRQLGAVALVIAGCSGEPAAPVEEVQETEAAALPTSAGSWLSAWRLQVNAWWIPSAAERLVTPTGIVPVPEGGTPCGEGLVITSSTPILLALGPGVEQAFPRRPAVQAPLMERAAWRVSDVLGEPEGLVAGGSDLDPATYKGARVRSVAKTRRRGSPPVQLIVGDRKDEIAVLITDRDAREVHASAVLEAGPARGAGGQVVQLGDLDDDGTQEFLVWGDLPVPGEGGYRAVLSSDLHARSPTLVARSFETSGARSCP